MTYLRRSTWICCVLAVLLFVCSACSAKTTQEYGNVDIEGKHESMSYEEKVAAAVETVLKNRLRNPESLQIHSISQDESDYEDDSAYFCTVIVDYSAQNGFGGFNRETIKIYIVIDKATETVTDLDEATYLNKRVKMQFGDGLCAISANIPMQLICEEDTFSQLRSAIIGNREAYSTFTYKNGEKEMKYVANLGDLEGTATFYFYSESEKIWQINFFWSDGQCFYDGTNAYTLGSEYIATLEDVDALRGRIDDALNVPHGQIKETTETYFHDYECRWELAEGIYIKLSWSTNDMDGSIGHIQLLLCNEVNGGME